MIDRLQTDLSRCEIFAALESSTRERLRPLLRPRSYGKNEVIFFKGDPGNGLYLIRSGKVKVCVDDRNGVELIFTFLSEGDILGDMAVLDGQPRSATAMAVERTDTFYLDRQDFLKFLQASPQACIEIMLMLCQRLRRLSLQMEELSFLDVSGRIARSLMKMAGGSPADGVPAQRPLSCVITQEELANFVGASRVMVNKVLNSYVDLGIVSIARKKITISNVDALNRIALYDAET